VEGKVEKTRRLRPFWSLLAPPLLSGGVGVLAAIVFWSAAPADMRPGAGDLIDALRTEAYDYLTYKAYADAARRHGNRELALLYERNANIEWRSHFSGDADFAGLIRSDAQNLRATIAREDREDREARQLYPEMARRAEVRGERKVAEWVRSVAEDEAAQRREYLAALRRLEREELGTQDVRRPPSAP
jgi:rubrerythrin